MTAYSKLFTQKWRMPRIKKHSFEKEDGRGLHFLVSKFTTKLEESRLCGVIDVRMNLMILS